MPPKKKNVIESIDKSPIKFTTKKIIFSSIIYALLVFIIYYLFLPRINFKSVGFYFFLIFILFIPFAIFFYRYRKHKELKEKRNYYQALKFDNNQLIRKVEKNIKYLYTPSKIMITSFGIVFSFMLTLLLILSIPGWQLVSAKSYASQANIVTKHDDELKSVFSYENGEVKLPVIDKALSFKLAQAKLGDYGAQYHIDSNVFTIITIVKDGKDELVRVTPLEYENVFVAMSKGSSGSVGYILVNVITKEAELIKTKSGMKFLPSGVFSNDLDRHIRFKYSSKLYASKYFEIDDDGNPYWIVPTHTHDIGVFGGKNPEGVIIVNPLNGDTNYYNLGKEPYWVDRTVDESIVSKQVTNALRYKNGFFNTLFSKNEVFQLSDGYNYFMKNGEAYYVSAVTSPNESDQTSIGFIAINLKTYDIYRYNNQGITEMRARDIAQLDERVKAQALEATWPILITYQDIPTYFLVLKNDVQTQKYVFINVTDGSLVAMGDSINEAKANYETLLNNIGLIENEDLEITGVVTRIRDIGTAIEFILDYDYENYYSVQVSLDNIGRFLQIGDKVKITYKQFTSYRNVTSIQLV